MNNKLTLPIIIAGLDKMCNIAQNSNHLIINSPFNDSNYFYTTSFNRYCNAMINATSNNPGLHLLFKTLELCHCSYCDSGWFGLYLLAKLLYWQYQTNIPIYYTLKGLQISTEYVCGLIRTALIEEDTCVLTIKRFDISNAEELLNIILLLMCSINGGTLFTNSYERRKYSHLLASVFVSSSKYSMNTLTSPKWISNHTTVANSICYQICSGYNSSNSIHKINTIIMNIPLVAIPDVLHTKPYLTILLINDNIELPKSVQGKEEYIHEFDLGSSSAPYASITSMELEYLQSIVKLIVISNIQVLACQKRIHPVLKDLLLSAKVCCIERLSIQYIGFIQQLSGAVVLGNIASVLDPQMEQMDSCYLGLVRRVANESIMDKVYVTVEGIDMCECNKNDYVSSSISVDSIAIIWKRMVPVSMLFITAMSDNDGVELQMLSESIIHTLQELYVCPYYMHPHVFFQWIADKLMKHANMLIFDIGNDRPDFIIQSISKFASILREYSMKYEYVSGDTVGCVKTHLEMFEIVFECMSTILGIDGICLIKNTS